MQYREEFERNGYIRWSSEAVEDLRSEIGESLQSLAVEILTHYDVAADRDFTSMGLGRIVDWCSRNENEVEITGSMYDLFRTMPAVMGAVNHEAVLNVADELDIEEPSLAAVPSVRIDKPGDREFMTPTHQDFWFSPLSDLAVVFWFPVRPLSEGMGVLEVVPGSHEKTVPFEKNEGGHIPYTPIDEPEDDAFEPVMVEDDEILVFHQKLLHRSGFNSSDNCRISLQIRMNDLSSAPEPEPTFVAAQSPYVENRQQELLEKWGDAD